jgi:DNA invertase Pin-like site-specific DNA recombinase
VFAEFERSLMVERVRAGLVYGAPNVGRPRVPVETEVAIKKLRRQGRGIGAIASELGCGRSAMQRVLASV